MPPASFYHRFLRVLLGVAMFVAASYTAVQSAILAIAVLFFSSLFSSKYPLQIEDLFIIIPFLIALAGAILSLLAAHRIVRYSAHPVDRITTMYAVMNALAVIFYWNRLVVSFSSSNEILHLAIAAIAGLVYLGSALAIIRVSRRLDGTTSANSSSHLIK